MPDDRQLLLDYARHGDVKSLSALVVGNAKWLTAYLRGMSPSEADAEDAFQATWEKVIRSCGSYRGGSVRAYLTRVARSVTIDRFRRDRLTTVSADAVGDSGESVAETLADEAPTPGEAFESSATAEDVRRAIQTLPEGQREVVLMRIEGELSFKEIAELMGIPLGTALTWMHNATIRLKEILGERE